MRVVQAVSDHMNDTQLNGGVGIDGVDADAAIPYFDVDAVQINDRADAVQRT